MDVLRTQIYSNLVTSVHVDKLTVRRSIKIPSFQLRGRAKTTLLYPNGHGPHTGVWTDYIKNL